MSLEEDSELRDLVVKSLESNGILAKLKAQLRASIFVALEEENSIQDKIPYVNNKLKNFLEHKQGKLLFLLIKDTLEYFDLDYTKSVFDAETRLNDSSLDHSDVSKEFNIETTTTNEPLLYNLLFYKTQKLTNNYDITETRLSEQLSTETECISPKPITQIRTSIKNINNKTFTKLETPDLSRESSSDLEKDSSIIEDCLSIEQNIDENYLIDFEKSLKLPSAIVHDNAVQPMDNTIPLNLLDDTISKIVSNSSTVSDKLDKVKPFSSLSSLGDLPPLNMSKNRNDPILLPSLYSKDRKYSSDSQSCDESIDMDNIKSHSS